MQCTIQKPEGAEPPDAINSIAALRALHQVNQVVKKSHQVEYTLRRPVMGEV